LLAATEVYTVRLPPDVAVSSILTAL